MLARLLVFYSLFICMVGKPVGDQTKTAENYMKQFGYMNSDTPTFKSALSELQRRWHLKQTGTVDTPTKDLLQTARCSASDFAKPTYMGNDTYHYCAENTTLVRDFDTISTKAHKYWKRTRRLAFIQVQSGCQALIKFKSECGHRTFSVTFTFDFISYVIKMTSGSRSTNSYGNLTDTEALKIKNPSTNHVEVVINVGVLSDKDAFLRAYTHALGHVAGYTHATTVQDDPMSPLFPQKAAAAENDERMCNFKLTSIFSHMGDGKTYAVKKKSFWRLTENYTFDSGYPMANSKVWKGIPDVYDEGFVWAVTWSTYFFKGNDYYRYDSVNHRASDGYPISIATGWHGVPSNIDAAFTDAKFQTYFFKGDQVYLFDNSKDRVADDYPKPVQEVFPKLPSNIDTAFRYYLDGKVYFFKDDEYWRWNPTKKFAEGPFRSTDYWLNICN